MHVHVHCGHGGAKYWLEPKVGLAQNHGLTKKDLVIVSELIEEHENEIRCAWRDHFGC